MGSGKHSSDFKIEEKYDYEYDDPKTGLKKVIIIIVVLLAIVSVLIGVYFGTQIFGNQQHNKNNAVVAINSIPTPSIVPTEDTNAIPSKVSNYKVLGKLTIDKIKVEQYILEKTETESLKLGVTKLYGGSINKVGNFCIAGHNTDKFFKDLNKLEIDDTFLIEDLNKNKITYKIYDKFTVEPDDMSPLVQTKTDKEVTLITCEDGATSRLVIKAKEYIDIKKNDNTAKTEKNTTEDSKKTQE